MNKLIRKNILRLILLTLVIILDFTFAFAGGVISSTHEIISHIFPVSSIGSCPICHIPHKSPGLNRYWTIPNRGFGPEGEVGNLCFACHSSNGYGSTLLTEASYAEKYVFPGVGMSRSSHGLTVTKEYEEGTVGSELPYANIADDRVDKNGKINTIQCTTCHNVHDNMTHKPFLRDNIKTLCSKCHKKDNSHTDNFDLSITRDKEGSPAVFWKGTGFELTFTLLPFKSISGVTDGMAPHDGGGVWNLGRHLATDEVERNRLPGTGLQGGITCVTCHAVHGVQDDSDANNPITLPNENLLSFA
jgi:predicted CXXCH cytochrome family protein